jgi:N-acetylmuramic acid 6-phosphate etherase
MQPDADDFLASLVTEAANPSTTHLDAMDPLDMIRAMNAEDATVTAAVESTLPEVANAVQEIAKRLRRGGRLIYAGAGTSGRLGVLDASECPPTFNTPPTMVVGLIAGGREALTTSMEDAEDSTDAGRFDVQGLKVTETDTVVGITASGRTPYVLGAVAYAREQGALTVAVVCNKRTPLEKIAEITIAPIVGPEVISGSTRLKAGTAQKMVLNMLSTGAMVLLGKTYGNLMVDVQPKNTKLRRRAVRMVRQVTGLEEQSAENLLRETGDVKTAIVAGRAGLSPTEARIRLAEHGGNVRAALGPDDASDSLQGELSTPLGNESLQP